MVLLGVLPFVPLRLSAGLWLLLCSALAVVCVGATVIALAAWRRDLAMAMLVRPVTVLLPARARLGVEAFVVQFTDSLVTLIRQPRLLLIAGGYTAVALCLDALFCWLAFRAVGVDVAVPIILYGYTFFNLSFVLPSPPGQVGSNELIGLLIFSGSFGVSRAGVAAMFLFSHPWTGLIMTCMGLICLSTMGLNIHGTLRLTQNRDELPAGDPQTSEQGAEKREEYPPSSRREATIWKS